MRPRHRMDMIGCFLFLAPRALVEHGSMVVLGGLAARVWRGQGWAKLEIWRLGDRLLGGLGEIPSMCEIAGHAPRGRISESGEAWEAWWFMQSSLVVAKLDLGGSAKSPAS